MPLQAGAKLGAYEILAAVEAGDGAELYRAAGPQVNRRADIRVLRAVDAGDGAKLYRASDPQLNREVAIKVLGGPLSERGEQEALAIAALHHPNICALHDIGNEEGTHFLVMECLEG